MAKREIAGRIISTQEQILAAALRLFNGQGAGQVTVRQIAAAAGMSHGNLCYHFPNTEALVERLYEDFAAKLNNALEHALARPALSLAFLLELARGAFVQLHEYRFLLLDFTAVMRRFPAVREHYQAMTSIRGRQFRLLLDGLAEAGLLRPEPLPGQFDRLTEQFALFGDGWIAHAELFYEGRPADKIAHYIRLFAALLTPYLTEKGLEEFRALQLDAAA